MNIERGIPYIQPSDKGSALTIPMTANLCIVFSCSERCDKKWCCTSKQQANIWPGIDLSNPVVIYGMYLMNKKVHEHMLLFVCNGTAHWPTLDYSVFLFLCSVRLPTARTIEPLINWSLDTNIETTRIIPLQKMLRIHMYYWRKKTLQKQQIANNWFCHQQFTFSTNGKHFDCSGITFRH